MTQANPLFDSFIQKLIFQRVFWQANPFYVLQFLRQKMIQKQQNSDKKLRLREGDYEALILLNSQLQTLQIALKHLSENKESWGRFTMKDFDQGTQAFFVQIDKLYEVLCQDSEEITFKKDRLTINLNFLKNPKQLEFRLSPMLMFSESQHDKLIKKIAYLQGRVFSLENKQGRQKKLTLQLSQKTVTLNYYQIKNFTQIKPIKRERNFSFLRKCEQNQIPSSGLWTFTLQITSIAQLQYPQREQDTPYLSIGLDNSQGQVLMIKIKSEPNQGQHRKGGVFLAQENDLLRVRIYTELKKIAVNSELGRGQEMKSWAGFMNCENLWLRINLFKISICTDLFVQPTQITWTDEIFSPTASQVKYE